MDKKLGKLKSSSPTQPRCRLDSGEEEEDLEDDDDSSKSHQTEEEEDRMRQELLLWTKQTVLHTTSHCSYAIVSETWTVKTLMRYIENQSICKTKFQRKLKWTLKPTNSRCANMRDYVIFLFQTKNSLQPLAFGKTIVKCATRLENIDGNNRINAIYRFMIQPFSLFDEYIEKWESLLNEHAIGLATGDREILTKWFLQLSYIQIASKQTFKSVYKKKDAIAVRAVVEKMSVQVIDVLSEFYNTVHEALLLPGGQSFDQGVTVLVNLFEDATVNDLNDLFQSMNKYNGTLAVNDLLASRLFSVVVTVRDATHNIGIRQSIKEYYDEKGQAEVLSSFRISIDELHLFEMNGFDFLIGLQNYCSRLFPETLPMIDSNSKGLPCLSRFFATLFGDLSVDSMSPDNIYYFVLHTIDITKLLKCAYDHLFPGKVNDSLFHTAAQRSRLLLSERSIYLIYCFGIALKRQKLSEREIVKSLTILLAYSLLTRAIATPSIREVYAIEDKLLISVTESTSTGLSILSNPSKMLQGITYEKMKALLEILVSQSSQPSDPENEKQRSASRRRRKWTTTERMLTAIYYARKMPSEYLDKEYSIEHIVPFSCVWPLGQTVGNVERLGNLVPFLLQQNRTRGNRSIEFYYESCPQYIRYLDCIPSVAKYHEMVTFRDHQCQIPMIHQVEKFNAFCEENEKKYIAVFLDYLGLS